jgi:lysophospholipase L1-like esterase
LVFADRWDWLAVVGAPWFLGGALLFWMPSDRWTAAACAVDGSRHVRFGLIVCAGLGLALSWLLGTDGLVMGLVLVGTVAAVLVRFGPPASIAGLPSSLALLGTTLLLIGFVGEWLVSRDAFARTWGSPAELASWETRYDELARLSGTPSANMFGFRSAYEQVEKPRGTFRVLVLGDSYTWGDKIAHTDSTWPAQLESLLREQYGGRRVEVVNAAMRGYTTFNEVEVLNRIGWQFQPDLVVLQWFRNDAFPSWPGLGRAGAAILGTPHILPVRLRSGALGRSALLAFLEHQLRAIVLSPDYGSLYEDGARGWIQMQSSFADLGRAAEQASVPALVVLAPALHPGQWDATSHPDRQIHQKVRTAAEDSRLHVLDLTSAFADAGLPGVHWWATPYDSHPGVEAHRLIAERVFAYIVEHGLLPLNAEQEGSV